MSKLGYASSIHKLSVFTALSTWILIIAGSLVTSTESGLSVPDWPLSYGQLFPPMVGGVRFEHTHRMIAGFVAILTAILAFKIWRRETRYWVRLLGISSLVLVIIQAILGGLTVLLLLPPAVSILHAFTAQTFFVLTIVLSLVTSKHWLNNYQVASQSTARAEKDLLRISTITLVAAFIQLILGAMKRHDVAPINPHLVGAIVVTLLAWNVFIRVNRFYSEKKLLWLCGFLLNMFVLTEIFLGMATWAERLNMPDEIAPTAKVVLISAAHVATGVLVLASAVMVFLISLALRQD